MTDRELMEKACDFLLSFSVGEHLDASKVNDLIYALRERLVQSKQEPVAWMHNYIEDNIIWELAMTDRELMQQALNVLNVLGMNYAISAKHWPQTQAAITALRDRLAQTEQEPVAWMHNYIEDNIISDRPYDLKRHPERWTALYPAPSPCPTCEALARTVMLDQTSHDTKREWVGLTDNEADEVYRAAQEQINEYWESGGSTIMFPTMLYKAIEAKLKEKNT